MKATTVYLHPDQLEKLKQFSRSSGIPMAVFMRRGIDLAIEEWQEKGSLNLGPDTCQKVEESVNQTFENSRKATQPFGRPT